MTRKVILIGMYFLFLSQVVDPNGTTWDFTCDAAEPFDSTGFATAFYNDPDQDCISNEFLIFFNYADGHIEPYTPWDQYNNDPVNGGFYDFDSNFWGCCTNSDQIGGSGGIDPDNTCPCEWEYEQENGFLLIDCPDDC